MNATNIQLLKKYVEDGDQQAFTRLVENLINVAYSVAMSCLGSEDQARDACQLTFLELSKRAKQLSPKVQLGGWVHATARNFSRKIQRTEHRRRNREQHYVDDMKTHQQNEPDWSRLTPEIHEVLHKLNAQDREAIILRFFQDQSLVEVGATMGISADAARMRLNRALERVNRQLVRRGITSTVSALAAALPSHVLATAPAGLAPAISTSVLAGAGTVGTSTLIGATLIIMKTKTVLITAVVAATALTGTGVYYAVTSDKVEATEENGFLPATDAVQSQAALSSDQQGSTEFAIEVGSTPETDRLEQQSGTLATAGEESDPDGDTLNIDPVHLEQASQQADLIKMTVGMMDNDAVQNALASQIENPSRKIQLRMSLDPDTAARFDEVLSSHAAAETKRVQDGANSSMNIMGELIDTDRESIVNFLALQSMQQAGMPMNAAQNKFIIEYALKMAEMKGFEDIQKMTTKSREWYEADEVFASLNEGLSPEQQATLAEYAEEQINRKKEETTYKRTNKLANMLGLNEVDRAALYEYLYENPDASDDDITEQLSPELRVLMPEKNHVGLGVKTSQ